MAEADAKLIEAEASAADVAQPPKEGGSWGRLALMLSVPLLLAIIGSYFYLTSGRIAETDNAYVQQNKVAIAAEVGGRIVAVYIKENQRVKAGDLLYKIDPQPYQIAIAQADAQIAQAEVQIGTLRSTLASNDSAIAAAHDSVKFAQETYNRNDALMRRGFNTRAAMDSAHHDLVQAQQELATAQAAAAEDQARLATGSAANGQNPEIAAAMATRAQAELQLSRTEVRAPTDGIVTQMSTLQVGQMMVTGLPAVTIVSSGESWVEANFKETDLNKMLPGQKAVVEIDAYPDLKLKGHVESLGAGTGSEFSILPAQNANGNWVKVTQRVPVRIAIDEKSPRPLLAGLSATITVTFNDRTKASTR
ncbi:MAG: HlyD family secretion protein [Sphingorhabdus sp.]